MALDFYIQNMIFMLKSYSESLNFHVFGRKYGDFGPPSEAGVIFAA